MAYRHEILGSMKQIKLTFLLTVLMSMVGAKSFAHSLEVKNADGVTIYYNYINNGTELEVTYRGSYYYSFSNEYTGNVVIPSEVTYNNKTYSVTSIKERAFRECSSLTSVTIPNSVRSIGNEAFRYCSGLTSITIPNSVTTIGSSAFSWCSSLTSVTIDSNSILSKKYTSSINIKDIFGSQVKAYTIGNNVNTIGDYAFYACSSLTSITISNSVTSIGSFAFYDCSGLTSVTIPNSVTSIGIYVFSGCSGLTSVTIPNSVTSIGSSAFYDCSGLVSVTIGTGVLSIGSSAFFSAKPKKVIWLTESILLH